MGPSVPGSEARKNYLHGRTLRMAEHRRRGRRELLGAMSPERLGSKEEGRRANAEVVEDPSRMAREGLQP